jgi:hypothetical protein
VKRSAIALMIKTIDRELGKSSMRGPTYADSFESENIVESAIAMERRPMPKKIVPRSRLYQLPISFGSSAPIVLSNELTGSYIARKRITDMIRVRKSCEK